jgi:hypothetical protein
MRPAGNSPYATKDPEHHAEALGRIDADEVHEFYHPFVMLKDLPLELVRVVSPGYGAMDMILLLQPKPIRLYVNHEAGARFMRERFPKAKTFRVEEDAMRLVELDRGATLVAELRSDKGPIRELSLVIKADPGAALSTERYESHEVWGSAFECHGIDMRQAATCRGIIEWEGGKLEPFSTPATIFRGSYGKLAPVKQKAGSVRRQNTR